MAEPTGSGAVEREARHLVEAAARWLSAVPDHDPSAPGEDADGDSEPAAGGEDTTRDGGADASASQAGGSQASGGGDEHLCRGCPWCRAKAAVGGPLGADTLDSLAHLLGAAAESLSLFAQARREAAAGDHDTMTDEGATNHDAAEEDEEMLDAVIWIDEEDDEEAAEERRRNR